MSTIAEDENKSFGEIFACFDNQTLNLCQIMNWPVTNKPYSICSEDGKVKNWKSVHILYKLITEAEAAKFKF